MVDPEPVPEVSAEITLEVGAAQLPNPPDESAEEEPEDE